MTGLEVLANLHDAGIRVDWSNEGVSLHTVGPEPVTQLLDYARKNQHALAKVLRPIAEQAGAQRIATAPLSHEQRQLDFSRKALDLEAAMLISIALRFEAGTAPSPAAIEQAVYRHPMLHARVTSGSDPFQVFQSPAPAPEVLFVDLRHLPTLDCAEARGALLHNHARRHFRLSHNGGFRALLVAEKDHLTVQLFRHHLVSDGWSLGLLLTSIAEADAALRNGIPTRAEESRLVYAEYACRQYAEEKAGGVAASRAPTISKEMFATRARPGRAGIIRRKIGDENLRRISAKHKCTEFVSGAALFAIALAGWRSVPRVAFAIDVNTRNSSQLEECIGTFVNRATITVETAAMTDMQALVQHVRQQVAEAVRLARTPATHSPTGSGGYYESVAEVIFGIHAEPRHAPYRHLRNAELVEVEDHSTHVPLSVYLSRRGTVSDLELRFDTNHIEEARAEKLAQMLALACEQSWDNLAALRRGFIDAARSRRSTSFADSLSLGVGGT